LEAAGEFIFDAGDVSAGLAVVKVLDWRRPCDAGDVTGSDRDASVEMAAGAGVDFDAVAFPVADLFDGVSVDVVADFADMLRRFKAIMAGVGLSPRPRSSILISSSSGCK